MRDLDLQRNGRRAAAGADVQDGSSALQYPGGRHRLEDQAVDGLVAIVKAVRFIRAFHALRSVRNSACAAV